MTDSIATGVAYRDAKIENGSFTGGTISGSTIDNATIGATTPVSATFTNLTVTGNAAIANAATDYLAFYNGTLSTQPTSANQAAVATAAAITAGGAYGFASAGQANGIVTLLNQLRSDFVTLGLIKGS